MKITKLVAISPISIPQMKWLYLGLRNISANAAATPAAEPRAGHVP